MKNTIHVSLLLGLLIICFRWGADHQDLTKEEIKFNINQKRKDVVRLATQLIDIKYKNAGKSPKTGFDCSGFTSYVMKKNGIKIPSHSSAQLKKGVNQTIENAQEGDLIFFKKPTATSPFHVAIIYQNINGQIKIIHSTSSQGVIINDLSKSKYWNSKVWMVKDVIEKKASKA
ncbi:MAG: C40 family peptidase [Saprospiraceae bacterium]